MILSYISFRSFKHFTISTQDETVLKILTNLDLRSLCRLCRVNKRFNSIARDALLYTCLNLKLYWHCLDTHALNSLAPRCQYLRQLDLSWCGNYKMFNSQDIFNFLDTCGSLLTHLRLNCCRVVNDCVVLKISKICKNLKGMYACKRVGRLFPPIFS